MKKNIGIKITAALALALAISLTACSSSKKGGNPDNGVRSDGSFEMPTINGEPKVITVTGLGQYNGHIMQITLLAGAGGISSGLQCMGVGTDSSEILKNGRKSFYMVKTENYTGKLDKNTVFEPCEENPEGYSVWFIAAESREAINNPMAAKNYFYKGDKECLSITDMTNGPLPKYAFSGDVTFSIMDFLEVNIINPFACGMPGR